MRLSNNLIYQNSIDSVLNGQEKLVDSQLRVSSQKKYLSAAEDPAAIKQADMLSKKLALNEQYSKNIGFLEGRLQLEESTLSSINTQMDRVRELTIQAGSGALSASDRNGISKELTEIQKSLFNLMNTQSEDGRFIFSGFQDQQPSYVFDSSTNSYQYNGDQGSHSIQVAPSTTIQSSDNGAEIFEKSKARLNITSNSVSSLTGNVTGGDVVVAKQAAFDQFHNTYYDPLNSANNTFNVVLTAGTPAQYEIQQNGNPLIPAETGDFIGDTITFAGMEINLQGSAPGQADFALKAPTNKNILNSLQSLISVLGNASSSPLQTQETLADSLVEITSSQEAINSTWASIGGRLNAAQRTADANSGEQLANQVTKAELVEIDMAEAISELQKNETALQAAQATFGRVSQLSLFDYI
jgi:flagellar hook-associated protein 3 FlgL